MTTKGMKSDENKNGSLPAERFWHWFADRAASIASNPENDALISELDQQVSLTWPDLAWEIGPDPSGGWYFALSPNLDRALINRAKEGIRSAPKIIGWKFHATRQRKTWDGRFELETDQGIKHFNCSGWRFVLLQYPNGQNELVLVSPDADSLEPEERWQAAAIVLEALLGEEWLLSNLESFSFEAALDEKLASASTPIRVLPQTFGFAYEGGIT